MLSSPHAISINTVVQKPWVMNTATIRKLMGKRNHALASDESVSIFVINTFASVMAIAISNSVHPSHPPTVEKIQMLR